MNSILKILIVVFVLLLLLNGCISQYNPKFGQNFDQTKAAKTRVSLGLTYLKNGNFSQAKFNLDKALEFAPRSADANFAIAYYYQNVGELEQAESAYQYAMELEPKNANIANSYGVFLCQNGDYEKAKKYFFKAVNISSYISSAETYENLALCSLSQGKPEDARQYLRSAINHQPGRANSLFLLARSLVESQQWQEARDVMRRFEKSSQISPQSLIMSMKIERGTGNVSAANEYSGMLLKIFPNDPVTKSFLAKQKVAANMVNKTEKTSVSKNKISTLPDPIESLPIKNISDISSTRLAKNDSLTNVSNASINSYVIDEAVAEQQTTKIIQVGSEIIQTTRLHVVVKGENLFRISLLYNIKMQRLIDWNSLADASAINVGKKLYLVAPSVVE